MFNIRFMKAPPTTYVLHYKDGRVKREGPGLSFFTTRRRRRWWRCRWPRRRAVRLQRGHAADFQAVTVQGQLTYRVAEPQRLASLLDFSSVAERQARGARSRRSRRAAGAGRADALTPRGDRPAHAARGAGRCSEAIGREVLAALLKQPRR